MAPVGQEVAGTISEVSRKFGISRPTIYEARNAACEVLSECFERAESAYRAVRVEVDEGQLEHAVVALRVLAPNAMRPIAELLPFLYPGIWLCYGNI
jgi:transposase-like protein